MAANWISVEQVLTDSGIFKDFDEKVSNLQKKQIDELQIYLDKLRKYTERLEQVNNRLKLMRQIKSRERKLANHEYTARGEKQVTTYVKNLKDNNSALLDNKELETFIQNDLLDLMELEQQIMTALINMKLFEDGSISVVDAYAIYFYGEKNSNGTREIVRGEIRSDDKRFKKSLFVDSEGNINLSVSIIKELTDTEQEVIANAKNSENNVYQMYMDNLIREAGAFYNDIVKQIQNLLKEARQEHIGNDRDSKLDASIQAINDQNKVEKIIEQHQENLRQFLYSNQNSSSLSKNQINRGHLAEAFERLYQAHKDANPNEPNIDYAKAVEDSLGNDPWYKQGDVGSKQVKSFFDRNNRQVASFSSLKSLCNNLIVVLESIISKQNTNKISETAKRYTEIQQQQLKKANQKLNNELTKMADDLVKSYFKGKKT